MSDDKEKIGKTIRDAVAPLKRDEMPLAREDMAKIKEAAGTGDLKKVEKAVNEFTEKRKSGKYRMTFGKKKK